MRVGNPGSRCYFQCFCSCAYEEHLTKTWRRWKHGQVESDLLKSNLWWLWSHLYIFKSDSNAHPEQNNMVKCKVVCSLSRKCTFDRLSGKLWIQVRMWSTANKAPSKVTWVNPPEAFEGKCHPDPDSVCVDVSPDKNDAKLSTNICVQKHRPLKEESAEGMRTSGGFKASEFSAYFINKEEIKRMNPPVSGINGCQLWALILLKINHIERFEFLQQADIFLP